MSFDPQLLLDLADKLCNDTNYHDESKYRTSISRAYYAAYLTARDKLESNGVSFSKNTTVHKEVIDKLRQKNRIAGNMLFNLRKERNKADYELDIEIKMGIAISCLKSSRLIIEKL